MGVTAGPPGDCIVMHGCALSALAAYVSAMIHKAQAGVTLLRVADAH